MLGGILVLSAVVFTVSYFVYGRYMRKVYNLDNARKVPSETMYDGVDYCPAHPSVLLGHHFSSIAGAGPIVGPIAAASLFGWLPAYLWCLIGSVFFGGPHDMGSVVSSMRHQGKSVGEVVDKWIGRRGKTLFICFTWLTLVLVVAVFLQLSADTFASDPAVAFSGVLYIGLAVIFGLLVYRLKLPLLYTSLVMVPIVLGAVVYGHSADWVQSAFALKMETWRWVLIGYIFFASVLPVWLLLQPRDYLASYLLYFAVIVGSIGMIFGGFTDISFPAFKAFTAKEFTYLWPILFVTVACGAISGFHCMVGSGTTSKQIRRETDAQVIGFGAMLLEGYVAIIALGTIMVVGSLLNKNPLETYGVGFGQFAAVLGMDPAIGKSLGLLAINSFILTSLDTATRLGRYQLQELTNNKLDRYTATVIGVVAAAALLFVRRGDIPAWKIIWPVFGASNQLVAALALLTVAVWVIKGLKKRATFLMLPMVFMLITTLAALVLLVAENWQNANYLLVGIGVVLFILALMLVFEAVKALRAPARVPEPGAEKEIKTAV
ncbi:MAG TPA: carbon starvation protein A [Candidatus Bathyarchaeia archaeon]|nr:carbon starvation protein A [Candidatus Bathyarchaeia archaeon]